VSSEKQFEDEESRCSGVGTRTVAVLHVFLLSRSQQFSWLSSVRSHHTSRSSVPTCTAFQLAPRATQSSSTLATMRATGLTLDLGVDHQEQIEAQHCRLPRRRYVHRPSDIDDRQVHSTAGDLLSQLPCDATAERDDTPRRRGFITGLVQDVPLPAVGSPAHRG
jgi:hypothetical protein